MFLKDTEDFRTQPKSVIMQAEFLQNVIGRTLRGVAVVNQRLTS